VIHDLQKTGRPKRVYDTKSYTNVTEMNLIDYRLFVCFYTLYMRERERERESSSSSVCGVLV